MLTATPFQSIRAFAVLSLSSLILSGCGEKDTAEDTPDNKPAPQTSTATTAPSPSSGQTKTSSPGVATKQIAPQQATPNQQGQRVVKLTPKQQEQLVNQVMVQQAKAQAAGFGNGSIHINAAWNYQGYSTLEMDPASTIPARLVAVDLTVSGHTVNFDYDDIEIIDGITGISYGSDPFAVFLGKDGKPLPTNQTPPVAPEPIRVLLVYAFPKASPRFSLAYWHKNIMHDQTFDIAAEGWSLPYPKK